MYKYLYHSTLNNLWHVLPVVYLEQTVIILKCLTNFTPWCPTKKQLSYIVIKINAVYTVYFAVKDSLNYSVMHLTMDTQ